MKRLRLSLVSMKSNIKGQGAFFNKRVEELKEYIEKLETGVFKNPTK